MRFTAIPHSAEAVDHVPADYLDRAESYHRNAGHGAATWPIRLTRCGQPPGRYGDTQPTIGEAVRGAA